MQRRFVVFLTVAGLLGCRDANRPTAPRPLADASAAASSYEIIDLGSLGGNGEALAINAGGQVVGWSETAPGTRHAFLWEDGVLQDLGALNGGSSEAAAINARGEVAGVSTDAAGSHAVLWVQGVLQDLGPGGSAGSVHLSESGRVAWTTSTPTGAHAALWVGQQVRDLGTLGGPFSIAAGVNDRGEVAGGSAVSFGGPDHAFLWRDGVMQDLGTLGGTVSTGFGINARGQVTGIAYDASHTGHAFLWDGLMLDLGWLPSDRASRGAMINDRGEVAGTSCPSECGGGPEDPFLWDGKTMQQAGGPDYERGFEDRVTAMNERGQVVGFREQGLPRHAFLWDGATLDLGTLGGQFSHSAALAINDRGDIVGWSEDASFTLHPVLWRRAPASPAASVVTSGP